jgi:hypothetical protein
MRVVAPASEDDMVAAFLRAEAGSPRFGPEVLAALGHEGLDRSMLEQPDTSDSAANAARRRVLAAYRGYPERAVFTGLPADTVWQWVALTRRELLSVRYIDWDYWLEVTAGTRRPVDAIARIGHSRTFRSWPPRSPLGGCHRSLSWWAAPAATTWSCWRDMCGSLPWSWRWSICPRK